MKKLMALLLLLPFLIVQTADAQTKAKSKAKPEDTPPYNVASEYVRSFSAIHSIQQSALNEIKDGGENPVGSSMNAIRTFTRYKLEYGLSIRLLEGMRITREGFNGLIPETVSLYKEKIKLYDEAMKISKAFMTSTPKPGVDYEKMAARMPEITANLEYLDQTLPALTTMVCFLLIDEKPDSEGHMNNLNISSKERQSLIDRIDAGFDESINGKIMTYTVGSAVFLKGFLQGDRKSTDEWKQNK
jgi:hypothetical protein